MNDVNKELSNAFFKTINFFLMFHAGMKVVQTSEHLHATEHDHIE